VRHGYAVTGHAGQGATVARAFVLGRDEGQLQEWGYVALSRARETTRLYVAAGPGKTERVRAELGDGLSGFASALERTSREMLASDVGRVTTPRSRPDRVVLDRWDDDGLRDQLRLSNSNVASSWLLVGKDEWATPRPPKRCATSTNVRLD
jgi:hypothetical protein